MSKKVIIVAMLLVAIISPMFAVTGQLQTDGSQETSGTGTGAAGTFIANFIKVVVIIAGAIFLAKGTFDLVRALIQSSHDPNAVGKSLIQMVIGVIILLIYFFGLKFVFGTSSGSSTDPTNVMEGIQGALVNLPLV